MRPSAPARPFELRSVRDLVGRQRRTAQLERYVAVEALEGVEERRESLPPRRAAEREQPERPFDSRGGRRRERVHVDRMADGGAQLRRLQREARRVDAEYPVREPRCEPQRPARVPVRVPEQNRHPAGARERHGERDESGNHVHEHRIRATEQRTELPLEREHATRLAARVERPHLDVRRDLVPVRGPAQHDHVVDALGKRTHEIERLRKRAMRRIQRLRDEDELHQRAPARTRSTSSR